MTGGKDPRQKRRFWSFIIVFILLILVFFYSLTTGSVKLSYSEVWASLTQNGSALSDQLIYNLRLPRILIAFLVGAALAIAGCLLQGVMRNPLADPGVIGVSAGGGLVAIILTIVFPALSSLVPLGAFLGAFGTALLIYLVAWDKGVSPLRVILSGVAINAFISAMTSGVMVLYSNRVQSVISWMTGTLSGKSWYHLELIWPYMLIGFILSIFAIRSSNVLMLGDDAAKLLGYAVERHRFFYHHARCFFKWSSRKRCGIDRLCRACRTTHFQVDYRKRLSLPFAAFGSWRGTTRCVR